MASQLSSILRTKENSASTNVSNSYSEPTDRVTRLSGSLSKRNHSETLQASIYNLPPFGNDVPSSSSVNFAYIKGTADNSTQTEASKNNALPSSAAMQGTSPIKTTISRFAPNSRITQRRMTFSGENSISVPISMTIHQYKSDSIDTPHFQTDSKATQSLKHFFPSTGRPKPFLAPNPAAYIPNSQNGFSASADEHTTAISNANNRLGAYTTASEKEARPESISFIGTKTLMKESNAAKMDATDILEDYTTLLDVPDMEDQNTTIIDATYLKRDGKTVSNAPDLPQEDNVIVIDTTDMKNHGRTTANAQTPSISSAKNSNDFESIPIPSTYNKANTKSITIATDTDEASSNVNPINTTNSFLTHRMYKKSNNLISNSNDTKTLDVVKNTRHVGDLIISQINGITSTEHYANLNPLEAVTNPNINFKVMWPSMEGTITEGRPNLHITIPNNNNIAEVIRSKVDDSIVKHHSNNPANVHLKTDKNNVKSNTNELEKVIPVIQETANIGQNDEVIQEIIFIHPDTSTTELRRKIYSPNPDAYYIQTARNKVILHSDIPNMFNPLFKYKTKPFKMDSTNLISNSDLRTPIIITANDAKAKMDAERTTVFNTANFQSNINPMISISHSGTVGSVYFSEDSGADVTSASKVSITPSDKYTGSVDEIISLSTNNNHADGGAGPKPQTDFPMNKGYVLPSVPKSSTLMPNVQNTQVQNTLLIKDDSLTDTWVSDPVANNPHLVNDAIIEKWKIKVDPLNIPLESTFLTDDFTSPSDEYNVISSTGKGTTNMTDGYEMMISKATMPEGRPTVAITSLPAEPAGIHLLRERFESPTDKEIAIEEESTPYVEEKSVVENDAVFQIKENLAPAHHFKYFESEDSGFERNGVIAVDTTKSLSQLSSIPTAEVTNARYLTTPGKENIDVPYDVTKPANDKIHLKTMATNTIFNGLGESVAVKQNAEAADGPEFLSPSNSIPQHGRMDHPLHPNLYYNVITDNPLSITKENSNVARTIMKRKLSPSPVDNADLIDSRDGYQTPAAITSSNAQRLANTGKTAGPKITNIPLGITTVPGDISYATSPINKGTLTMNEVSIHNSEPNQLGDDFSISREDPNVSGDDSTLLIANSSNFMKSVAPFNHSQAKNPIKNNSLAAFIISKTFQSKSLPLAATTASQGDADTMFYIPRLNHEADPQKDISIRAKEEDILKEENGKDHIIIPIAGDKVPTGKNWAAMHYSQDSESYNSPRFKGTPKTTADQLEFENPASSHMAEISKPLQGKFTPDFQERVTASNNNIAAEHAALFGSDIIYPIMKENVRKGYIFSPERSTFVMQDFRIPMKSNINPTLEGTDLLGIAISRTHDASHTDKQIDPGTEKDQIAKGRITNSHSAITPEAFSTPVSSEDVTMDNYYHTSGAGTPLSLGYIKTLRDDSYILKPGTSLAKEDHLDAMDLITLEPSKSDSEYISNQFELEEEYSPINKPFQFTHGPNGFLSHTPSSTSEISKSLLYRITHPEFETEEIYQTIIPQKENFDSDIVISSKDYTENFNTQHLKNMALSLTDAGEAFPPELLERSSVGKGTLPEDDAGIILPKVSDFGNKGRKDSFVPYTETNEESRTLGAVATDHAVIATPIKSQGHFYRKDILPTAHKIAAPKLEDTITLEISNVNENKMDLAELIPSEEHMNPLAQDIASQAENFSYMSEVTEGTTQTDLIASLNSLNTAKVPTNATTISPNASAFDSKESNENDDSTMPAVDGISPIKLKSLLIPNQKRPRTAITLRENYDSLSDTLVTLELSEPLGEHSTIIDQNWEATKVQSDLQPFSTVYSVPLQDPTPFSETPINAVTDIPITVHEDSNDKTDTMAFAPDRVLQLTLRKKEQINKTPDYAVNHSVNKAVINPSVREITTSATEANAFLSEDMAVGEDESSTSEAKSPKYLRKVNSVNINPFIIKPGVASTGQKTLGTLQETLHPDSTMSTTKLTKPRARDSFPLDNDNLERSLTNFYNKLYHLPLKPILPPTNFAFDFIKISNSELRPGESNTNMTNESLISNETVVLADKKIISPDNTITINNIRNIINGKRHVDSAEKDNVIQYEVIPFTKDFSAQSDVAFMAKENNPNNMNIMNIMLDDSTFKYVSEENTSYVEEEEKSSTTKTPSFFQGLHSFGSHAPFFTAHVTESMLNENPVELKTKPKYQMLISRKGNPDSDENDTFFKDYAAEFKSNSPRTLTHSLTDGNRKISPEFPDDLAPERGTPTGNGIIIILPEAKRIVHMNASVPEAMETVGESRMFPDKITDLTTRTTPVIHNYRRYVPFTALNSQREPTISPTLKYNQDKTFQAESYHSQDATGPSAIFNVNLNNELPFVNEDSENKKNRASASYSPMKTTYTLTNTTALSLKNSNERGDSMQTNENYIKSREPPPPLTTANIIVMPNILTEDSVRADNFVLGDSKTLKDDSFIGKFNISARPQAPPNLKGILSAAPTMSLEKISKPEDKNSAPLHEDAGTAKLFHDASAGAYGLPWKLTLSPSDFTTSVSSPKYSEFDPVVKKGTTTKINNNIPFDKRNTPSPKVFISANTNVSTKDMLNAIFNKRFMHRNFTYKDIITEYEKGPTIERISDITLDDENIPSKEDIISTVTEDKSQMSVTNEYVLEPQESKNNLITEKTTLTYDPKIVGSHPFYSSFDVSEHLSPKAPTEIKTKEMLQDLSREEHTSSDFDALGLKSPTDNLKSKASKSLTDPLTHTSEIFHKFLGQTTLKRDTLRENDIVTLPENESLEYTLGPEPEITVTMVEERMFPDEPTDPIMSSSPLKNKNQSYKKVTSSAVYNTDAQGNTENMLSSRMDNDKGKTNMAKIKYSRGSIIPLAEFDAIPDGKLSFINEDSEVFSNGALISSLPMNIVHTMDDITTLSTEGSYEVGNPMLSEDIVRSKEFLGLQIPEKLMFIPYASTENLEISDPVTNNSLVNSSIAWSNTFETVAEYPNSVNDGDGPSKNKTDLKAFSLTSTNFPIGFTPFTDNPTNNGFDSLPSVNRETTDISKSEMDEIYSEPQRTIMKAFTPTKFFHHRPYVSSDQEDSATKFYLNHITNAAILNPAMKKTLPSISEPKTQSKNNNSVEEGGHISDAGNFLPKDASALKDNSLTGKFDATSTKPQEHNNLNEIFSTDSTLTLPGASKSNHQSSYPEVAVGVGTIANAPSETHDLPQWKSTLLPPDFTTFMSSTRQSKLDPVIKMKKDTTAKTNNNIPPGKSNTPSDKDMILPTISVSTKGMKNTINNNKFADETFIERDIPTEVVPFIKNISEEPHDTLLAGANNVDIVTTVPVDHVLEYVEDNYVSELMKNGNGPFIGKITLTNGSNVFKSQSPYINAAVSERLSQGSPVYIRTTKEHQSFTPIKENSNNDATIPKSSIVNFNTKFPRFMTYSLTDSNSIFLPGSLDETIMGNGSLLGDNSIITFPKGKRMEYPFIADTELMTRLGENKIFTTDLTDPAVTTNPIEYKDQLKRRGISSAFYNNVVPDEAKTTISAILDANKHKPNLADKPYSQNNISPLTEFNVIPDNDNLFTSKNTGEANNRVSMFSSSVNMAASTVADSTEGSYEQGDAMFPVEDNVNSKGVSPLLPPNSLTEDPENSDLMTDNSLPESLITRSEVIERRTEYADAINGGHDPGRQIVITHGNIHSYPLAWNAPPTGSTTFADGTEDGEVDSFFSLNKDTPFNHKPRTGKNHYKSQRAMMKAFYPRKDSQNTVYKRRKIANLFDQEDPAAKLESSHFTSTADFIPTMAEILPSATQHSPLSMGNNNMDNSFTAKFDTTSFKPQVPPNFKGILLADSTLTVPEASRPASHDKVTNIGRSITKTPTGLYDLQWRPAVPPSDFTASMRTFKYPELLPVTVMGKDVTKSIDYNIPPEEIIIPSDDIVISPITSEEDMASTLKENVFWYEDLIEKETVPEYKDVYFTEDISERIDDISSAGKITPTYVTI